MKKVIAILAIFIAFGFFQVEGSNVNRLGNEKEDVNLVEMKKGQFDETRTRSVGPAVSACLDTEAGQIEIVFNASIGNVTICIINEMGQAIQNYNCDTETEWIVFLPAPTCTGHYMLKIDSSAAEYTGEFTL